MPNSNSNLKIF